ncbi:tho complex subunit [Niveomyces insectorum RCEF 264]|uniref:Tho complex subunit n=1 Tax=Niveomyces insectorum RCEF 264 TaxID=1081102 RepID=A0A167PGV4_9HYPO|nr:tho complex subunit [Niveomyces insectorum RCEF 264]
MPALEIQDLGVPAVEAFSDYLHQLLEHAEVVKPTRTLEPVLTKSDFDNIYARTASIFADLHEVGGKKLRQFAIIETAAREFFGRLIATTSIDSPTFVRVWNLFDILAILSDNMECDPPLLFWLIEELLDSQTIPGCRKVFDYLESRRERITAKYFNSTKLVILRSCNDLLRRLSRAEDTPFCGRVFIFLFQVFPLGDKSSVNLRGEYHVENVTTYDQTPAKKADGEGVEKMEVDTTAPDAKEAAPGPEKAEKAEKTEKTEKKILVDFDALYPVFWSLQTSFSQPKKLFDPAQFSQFRVGMEASLAAFQQISEKAETRNVRQIDEAKRGVKRKRDKEDDLADTYNPKYLTSRDLFELETSDLTFRRHFLLQALIIMEFLLSLSAQGKEKLATANVQNKSVVYPDKVLSDDEAAWAAKMKHDITEHIKSSNNDGPYFLRMVDTILARDKNWVRWKVESCPSIERPAVSAEEFVAAKDGAQRTFGRHRRRSHPAIGSLALDFLDDDDGTGEGEGEGDPDKQAFAPLPPLAPYEKEIANEDFEIEMPDSEASKKQAEERKASKSWRALRIVRQTKLAMFDKIDDDNNIRVVFRGDDGGDEDEDKDDKAEATVASGEGGGDDAIINRDRLPEDTRPVVLVAAVHDTAAALSKLLVERNPGVFGVVAQHATKPAPTDKAAAGAAAAGGTKPPYHYVDAKAFDVMLDGDKLVAFGEAAGYMYGTNKGQIDAVAATGKVPLVLMNYESVQSAKDNGFAARYVFVGPSSAAALTAQLAAAATGTYDDAAVAAAVATLEKANGEPAGVFDRRLRADDGDGSLVSAASTLKAFIYGEDEAAAAAAAAVPSISGNGLEAPANGNAKASDDGDTAMGDDTPVAAQGGAEV